MTKEELFEILELDTAEDFSYFEQMAELIEYEGDIPFNLFYEALLGMDSDTASTLIENYFEDFTNAIPDDEDDFVCLIESIKQNLLLGASNIDDESVRRDFAESLYYFRNWLHKDKGAKVGGIPCSVFTAVTEHRSEKLGGNISKYEFPSVKDYELDNISVKLGSYSKVDIFEDKDETDPKDFSN